MFDFKNPRDPDNYQGAKRAAAKYAQKNLAEVGRTVDSVGNNDRSDMFERLTMSPMYEAVYGLLDEWDERVAELEKQYLQESTARGLTESEAKQRAENHYLEILKDRVDSIRGLVKKMTSQEIRMTGNALMKIRERSGKFINLITKNPEQYGAMQEALRWALKIQENPQNSERGAVAIDDSERRNSAIKTLQEAVLNNYSGSKENPSPNFEFASMILSFASPSQRLEVLENVPKEILIALNHLGGVAPLEMQELLKAQGQEISEQELQTASDSWQEKHEFTQRAKAITQNAYGDENWMNANFNLMNLGRWFAYAAGGITIFANIGANWKAYVKDPTKIPANPMLWLGAGEIYAANLTDPNREESISETFAGKETIDNKNRAESLGNIYHGLQASPNNWKPFFDEPDQVHIFSEFVKENSENPDLAKGNLKLKDFIEYLESQDNSENLVSRFEKMTDTQEKNTKNNKLFNDFALAFHHLKIMGDNSNTLYEKALTDAQNEV
jgi:hypothetical protein